MAFLPSSAAGESAAAAPARRSPWAWSVRSLLALTALVAVYFGGRASMDPKFGAPQPGTWQLNMPMGAQRPVTLLSLGEGRFTLRRTGAMDGAYRWKNRRLAVETPDDKRMVGLAWAWDGDDLVLVAEPPGRPTGASYVGARLRFVSSDPSEATQSKVATINPGGRTAPPPPSPRTRVAQVPTELADLAGFVADPWREPPVGLWEIQVRPTSTTLKVRLVRQPNGDFQMIGGGVFSGDYTIQNDQFVVKSPTDKRMVGLAWAWKEDELVLVTEPASRPAGPSYLDARLRYVGPDERLPR